MSETIVLELYCIGSSWTIKAQTFCITKAKLGLGFRALTPLESQKGKGALDMQSLPYTSIKEIIKVSRESLVCLVVGVWNTLRVLF